MIFPGVYFPDSLKKMHALFERHDISMAYW